MKDSKEFVRIANPKISLETMRSVVLESMNEAVHIIDLDMNLLYINPAAERISGWSRNEIVGKRCYEVFGTHFSECVHYCPILSTKKLTMHSTSYIGSINTKNGRKLFKKWKFNPLIIDDKVQGLVIIMEDITKSMIAKETRDTLVDILNRELEDRKAAERRLLEERNFTQNILKVITSLIVVVDTEGTIYKVNRALENLLGYTKKELIGKKIWEIGLSGTCESSLTKAHKDAEASGNSGIFDSIVKTKSGEERFILWQTSTMRDLNGDIRWYIETGTDITPLKNTEIKLKESERRFRILFQTANEPILITDSNGIVLDINKRAKEFLGYPKRELIGKKPPLEILPIQKSHQELIADLFKHRNSKYETFAFHKNGKKIPINCSSSSVSLGDRDYWLLILSDQSEAKEIERLKQQFIATTSHELRTPLTIIRGYLDFILNHPDYPESKKQEFIKTMLKNVQRLEDLISKVHDFSKMERGIFELELTRTTVIELFHEIQQSLQYLDSKANIEVQCNPLNDKEIMIDSNRIISAIQNLTINAVHHSPPGSPIKISITCDQNYL
ncbi:MAG: PAS domain S-box protein, partial [Candidatus Hodarchaeales archaeon]